MLYLKNKAKTSKEKTQDKLSTLYKQTCACKIWSCFQQSSLLSNMSNTQVQYISISPHSYIFPTDVCVTIR